MENLFLNKEYIVVFSEVHHLYRYYTKSPFYQISLFCQLNIVSHKISKNHFKDFILTSFEFH